MNFALIPYSAMFASRQSICFLDTLSLFLFGHTLYISRIMPVMYTFISGSSAVFLNSIVLDEMTKKEEKMQMIGSHH